MSVNFSPWGKQVLQVVCASFIEEPICSNPKHGFETGIKAVVGNVAFRQYFQALCRNYSDAQDNEDTDCAASAVYNVVVGKVVHSRFAVPFRRFKMKHIKAKAKIALRNNLKVAAAGGLKHQTTATVTPEKKQKLVNPTSATKNSKEKTTKLNKRKGDYPSQTSFQSKAARFERRVLMNQKRAAAGISKCEKRKTIR